MILVDLSQIVSASIHMGDCTDCARHPSESNKNFIKHSIFNSIRSNFALHKGNYGQMVLACDSNSWRYDVYPQYKHSRKVKRKLDTSGINWDFVNEVKSELINDLKKYFPFPVVSVPKAEGDCIIGVLSKYITNQSKLLGEEDIFGNIEPEKILIESSDADNYQLHTLGKHVKQWAPMYKKMVKPEGSARNALIEKIVKGDPGDGIPNIKSHDNIFVEGTRQKPISQKYLQTFFDSKNPIDACLTDDERVNYLRNETLVSYEKIPQDIQDAIILCYNEQINAKHSKMEFMSFLTQSRMNNLLSNITDFYI